MKLKIPILMYHRLGEVQEKSIVPGHYVTQRLFTQHLKALRVLGRTTISLDHLLSGLEAKRELPKRPVVITFDDGYENFHTIGMPLLKQFEATATVFVVSGQVGGLNQWDIAKGDVEERLMSQTQILEAMESGIEIGAHTVSHANLSEVSADDAWREISESKEQLETLSQKAVDFFCYPYGRYGDEARQLVERAGFRGAVSTQKGSVVAESDRFQWGRLHVRGGYTGLRLAKKLLRMKPIR